jgi:hypothetical protein
MTVRRRAKRSGSPTSLKSYDSLRTIEKARSWRLYVEVIANIIVDCEACAFAPTNLISELWVKWRGPEAWPRTRRPQTRRRNFWTRPKRRFALLSKKPGNVRPGGAPANGPNGPNALNLKSSGPRRSSVPTISSFDCRDSLCVGSFERSFRTG